MFNDKQDSFLALRDIVAERTTPIVAWVGSGLSRPAKLPTWLDLRTELAAALSRKIETQQNEDTDDLKVALETITAETDFWTAFFLLKQALGATTYRDLIRKQLAPAQTATVPEAYTKLWRLNPSGVLNLNLDRLATKAHRVIKPEGQLVEFIGLEADQHVHLLKSPHPFVANLHGVAENVASWVFTRPELNSLLRNQGYLTFVRAALSSRVVVFLGMSADDVAAGKHIENLTHLGIDSGMHFWITHRTDSKTVGWAEKAGIRLIHYQVVNDSHAGMLQILDALTSHIPNELPAAPVSPQLSDAGVPPLPEPPELNKIADAEEIRRILNAHAARILKPNTQAAYEEYTQFCKRYNQAIYRAWFVSTETPENILLGYKLESEIASGAFGTVYCASDGKNEPVAVKVLHQQIRNNPERLQSFRRGVQSLGILQRRHIAGMVPYRLAAEIPAVVVMDFIDGPSLDQAVKKQQIKGWSDVLKYGFTLAQIIERSHKLPERVLHRDIRPSNIMIRHGWGDRADWEVVVLDFDLSWHLDATELSISAPGTSNGYLAPEQVHRARGTSTRHAAVDSFGLGMTLLFLKTGQEPMFSQHLHADWVKQLQQNASSDKCYQWRSVPRRYFRLIENATRQSQSERWDMTQIAGELSRLFDALANPQEVLSAELVAEELAVHIFDERGQWNPDELCTHVDMHNGVVVSFKPLEVTHEVEMRVVYNHTGQGSRAKQKQFGRSLVEQLESKLKNPAWRTTDRSVATESFSFSAAIGIRPLCKSLSTVADSLRDCLTGANPY